MEEIERFEEFFNDNCEPELQDAVAKGKKSVEIDFAVLDAKSPDLADKLLNDPEAVLDSAKKAIAKLDLITDKPINLEPRFKNLPKQAQIRIRNLRSEHIGKFISLDGVVRKASEVKPEISIAIFECPDCGNKIEVLQTERMIKPPEVCECGRKGTFKQIDRKLQDVRFVTIEEPFEIASAEKAGTVNVLLKDDLTSPDMQRRTDPGSRLVISGVLKELKRIYKGRMKTQLDMFLEANHVQPTEIEWSEVLISDEDEARIKEFANDPGIYEKIVSSIAPSMYGMNDVKEAIALQLFGGVPRFLPDGTRLRGDIHILLVGDPAVGKTQLLKLVSKIIPRGRYVSGKGVTGVGLTASVVKDEEFMGGWVLEAGAMVLCHKGLISIDEFDKMHKDDQIAMHEAMSTQTISVAKASIVATLPAETSVLGGANPKFGRFDRYRAIAEQIDVPDTILSRFDLKFVLRDVPDKEMDEKLASHVIKTRTEMSTIVPLIEPAFLRKYIAYARHNCFPQLTNDAAQFLKQFYVNMRSLYQGEDASTIAITLRQYEALVRLAEASAKIRLSNEVNQADADRAVKLMKKSIQQLGYDYETGKIDIDRTEGMASSSRNKIYVVLDIVDRLTKQVGREIPREEVIASAEDEGIKEFEVEDILQRLEREGTIWRPKQNFIQRM